MRKRIRDELTVGTSHPHGIPHPSPDLQTDLMKKNSCPSIGQKQDSATCGWKLIYLFFWQAWWPCWSFSDNPSAVFPKCPLHLNIYKPPRVHKLTQVVQNTRRRALRRNIPLESPTSAASVRASARGNRSSPQNPAELSTRLQMPQSSFRSAVEFALLGKTIG